MTTRRNWLGGVAGILGMAAAALGAETANAVSCARPLENPRVAVTTAGLPSVGFMRLYFRAEGQSGDYYVDMRKGAANQAWAVLPRTSADTSAVVYRAVAVDADAREIAVSSGRIPLNGSCPATRLSPVDAGDAANLVIGQTADQQHRIPPGFLCDGITSLITSQGQLYANQSCAEMAAADVRNPRTVVRADRGGARGIVVKGDGGAAVKPVSASRP